MFVVGVISWWYSDGWKWRLSVLREKIARTLDFFSIGLLARTLFSPFRQISAGSVRGPLGVKFRAFTDRLISRCIGAMVRSAMILVGIGAIIIHTIIGGIIIIGWGLLPLLPVIGMVLWTIGAVPSWTL